MSATLTLYAVVLLVGTVPCATAAVVLALRAARGKGWARRLDGWLSAWLGALVLQVAPYLLGFAGAYDRMAWLSNAPIAPSFFFGATTLRYALAVGALDRARWAPWLLAPPAAAFGIGLWVWVRSTWSGVAYGETPGPAVYAFLRPADDAFTVVCLAVAARLALRLRQHGRAETPPGTVPPTGTVARGWLSRFIVAAAVVPVVSVAFEVAYVLGAEFSYERQWWAHVVYVAVGAYVAGAGYGAHRALDAARNATALAEPPAPSGPPPLTADEVEAWKPRLDAWMRARRPHLRPDLTLASLADDVGLAAPALSHVVNAGFDRNVSEFVNGYRVREVQARLVEPDAERLTFLAVAMESGFRSKATFNRAFRRETGTTPSAWLAAHRREEAA